MTTKMSAVPDPDDNNNSDPADETTAASGSATGDRVKSSRFNLDRCVRQPSNTPQKADSRARRTSSGPGGLPATVVGIHPCS